ncbi:MAG: restriction endonuclease subunit R [Deltaproteobacteria bacterium]|nr:MAG: restriction endonuclease subunit R [Deltaproteobacteria bacterium]
MRLPTSCLRVCLCSCHFAVCEVRFPALLEFETKPPVQLQKELRRLLGLSVREPSRGYQEKSDQLPLKIEPTSSLTADSTAADKIALFRSLFRGRDDVYANFWTNERSGKKGYSPAVEHPWNSGTGKPKKYFPLTERVIHEHLVGEKIIGCYPLLKHNSCWFLACDFDKEGWVLDSLAFLDVCKRFEIPAYLERSRSGKGGHVWIFFNSPVSAVLARQLGMRILRETMNIRGEIDLASYDRFFPNQDFVPAGGFGNLIALPLQKKSRAEGNTEFVNPEEPDLSSHPDQWAFLSRVERLSQTHLEALLDKIPALTVGPGFTRCASPFARKRYPPPKQLRCMLGATISLEKTGMPPWMLSQIKHLASFHNPKFYERQKLRLSTFLIPRLVRCYQEDIAFIHVPRGILQDIRDLAKDAGSELAITDHRVNPERLCFQFRGSLTPSQESAVQKMLDYETGVLVAPPGAGKTVMGCYMVAKRNLPTLILAHRKPILEQRRVQLMKLLDLPSREIGQEGGGRKRLSGLVDLAMIQSLKSIEDLETFFAMYGFVVVDECHHLPAFTFEGSIKKAPVRYMLGLTATPYRRDGLQNIITMQCGPIRCEIEDAQSDLSLKLNVRETPFTFPTEENTSIQDIFRNLVKDEARNALIEEDVISALSGGRRCLILTQWKKHCRLLADRLVQKGKIPFVLSGAVGKRERSAILKAIDNASPQIELLLIATGEFLGEGFDCPQIDTLFLIFPLSFKGKIVQYVGRALRSYRGKQSVLVYDYFDSKVTILSRMHARRLKTYRALGFRAEEASA